MASRLETRLVRQLAARGTSDAKGLARTLLIERGDAAPDGQLTAHGKSRQALGKEGRAKDRAAKVSGRPPEDYRYSARTNRATLKKR
jgi:hypothetical protein